MADPIIHGFHEAFHIELVGEGLDPDDKTHPPPDTTPFVWGFETLMQLNQIRAANTGKMLFRAILKAGPWVRIIPRFPAPGFDKDCNADTGDDLVSGGPTNRATVEVRFSPKRFRPGSFCDRNDTSHAATLSHEILFHELVHALRYVTKKRNKSSVHGALFQYDNNEEFYAVLVTNIFISDPTNILRSGLRGGHTAPHLPLDKQLASSFEFFQSGPEVYNLIAQFFHDHHDFAHELACSGATFNPLAAYDKSPARARQMSHSRFATARAVAGNIAEMVSSDEFKSQFVTPLLHLIGN